MSAQKCLIIALGCLLALVLGFAAMASAAGNDIKCMLGTTGQTCTIAMSSKVPGAASVSIWATQATSEDPTGVYIANYASGLDSSKDYFVTCTCGATVWSYPYDITDTRVNTDVASRSTFDGVSVGSVTGSVWSVVAPVTVTPSQLSAGVYKRNITLTTDPIEIRRGDTGAAATITFTFGSDWNLTGLKAYLIAKASKTALNSTAIIDRECTITDAATGAGYITLTSAETATVGMYYAEIETRVGDDPLTAQTARQFKLNIVQDVRQ